MRSLPQALHDRARRLAATHQLQDVAAILGLHPSQIARMKKRGWIAPPNGRRVRPMPSDFVIQSRRMSHAELCRHYRAGNATICRWMREVSNRRPCWRRMAHDALKRAREAA